MNESQSCFRRGYSTIHNNFPIKQLFKNIMSSEDRFYNIFIDFRCVIDSILHNNYGIYSKKKKKKKKKKQGMHNSS